MAEKITWMVLKVDLDCPRCYKKIKKILCKFPEIKDQVFEMQNKLVKITVVSCCPEKIRDKLCSKDGKVIKSIEIIKPPEPSKEPTNKEKTIKPNHKAQPKKTEAQASTQGIPATLVVPIPAPGYPVPPGFWCPRCCGYIGPCYCDYGRVPQPPSRSSR